MRNNSLLVFLFVLSISLNAFIYRSTEENYAKVKRAFSKEDFNLKNKRLDKYGFENEYDKSVFFILS
ncbi:exported protein A EppA [Borreliella andersonii]|uniref:exported protein A EppA n=1 Tax=Borrelia andersonii TaxID=42109 RepID=UPI003AB323A5